jgi:hypothetical protein
MVPTRRSGPLVSARTRRSSVLSPSHATRVPTRSASISSCREWR